MIAEAFEVNGDAFQLCPQHLRESPDELGGCVAVSPEGLFVYDFADGEPECCFEALSSLIFVWDGGLIGHFGGDAGSPVLSEVEGRGLSEAPSGEMTIKGWVRRVERDDGDAGYGDLREVVVGFG